MERIKTTNDIGNLSGKILAFGGVYSNLQALSKMKEIADEMGFSPGNIICTGDVVGYCAQPEECVQLIKDWGIHCIAGNVEIQLREGLEDCGCDFKSGGRCDTFSRQWYPFAKEILTQDSINWMKKLPDFIRFKFASLNGIVVHGSFYETAKYIFRSTHWATKQSNFDDTKSDLIIAGHCGLPFHHFQQNKYWLNPGVIGMPANDGTSRVWYMILEVGENVNLIFSHHSFEYDNLLAAALMRERNLPEEYALTLVNGVWDNTEILPVVEAGLSGHKILF